MTPLSPHNRFEMPTWLKGLMAGVFALNIVAVLVGAALLWTNSQTDSTQGTDIRGLVSSQRSDQLAACRRGNDSRQAEIINLGADLVSLRADRDLLETVAEITADSPLARVYQEAVKAKKFAIHQKRKAIRETIEAQASVAVKRGSPIVDCAHKAYPLDTDQQDGQAQGGAR